MKKTVDAVRFYAAFLLAKISVIALLLTRRGGTNFPGELAIRICPRFLSHIDKPAKIIAVTGTNGKTTVANLIEDALLADGIETLNNRAGANIHSGIATCLLKGCTLLNHNRYSIAVLEVDERATPRIFPFVKPDLLVITNLSRDSIMRNAHPAYIRSVLERSIPTGTPLLLNADDLISSNIQTVGEKNFFGIKKMSTDRTESRNRINDLQICPRCHSRLQYEYVRYHHIGRAYCPSCGFKSMDYDYYATAVEPEKNRMLLGDKDGEYVISLPNTAIHNIYNMVTAAAVLRKMGYAQKRTAELLSAVKIAETRFSIQPAGKVFVANQMAKEKNAFGSSRAFDYVASLPGEKELILMMNSLGDQKHWSENVCWLYDCDFELLNRENIPHIIVTGPRGQDYHLRLLLAGVPEERISWSKNEMDAPDLLLFQPGETVYIFHGTDSISLAKQVKEKTIRLAEAKANPVNGKIPQTETV